MKTIIDAPLKQYTTIKIGGIAKTMLIPENEEELMSLTKRNKIETFIGGGVEFTNI